MTIERLTLNDPEAQSADPVAANIAALKALFPAAVADGRIDFDTLRQVLGDEVDDGDERYGLNWPGKRRARRLALTPSTGTLRPAREDSVDWETTRNLMIEGDNLEVLKLLQKSYAGKVKLIYIDPPYNTGADFVYEDDFSDTIASYLRQTGQLEGDYQITSNPEASGRFHSNWLSMIYPRLLAARPLLADEGIIVISIDDREFANARAICDQVFGAENFVGPIIRNTNSSKNQSLFLSVSHDYAIIYAKDIGRLAEKARREGPWAVKKNNLGAYQQAIARMISDELTASEITEELKELVRRPRFIDFVNYWNVDEHVSTRGVYRKSDLGGVTNGNLEPIRNPLTGKEDPVPPGGFRYDSKKLKQLEAEGRIHFHEDGSLPALKRYLNENLKSRPKSITSDDQRPDYSLLRRYGVVFDNPKQLAFMERLISLTDKDAVVLDFFAGSGTTGHAVLSNNVLDGGTRRFILVQLPEPVEGIGSIADLTRKRLQGAIADYSTPTRKADDLGFRSYKLSTSNLRAWEPGDDLATDLLAAADNIIQGRSDDDLLTELPLKQGIDLTEPILTETIAGAPVHAMGGGVLVVCLAPVTAANAEALADGIADWIERLDPVAASTVFFKDAGFENDVAKANVAAILEQRLEDKLLKVRSL